MRNCSLCLLSRAQKMMGLNCNEEDLAYTLSLSASKDSQVFAYVAWEGGGITTVRSTQQASVL